MDEAVALSSTGVFLLFLLSILLACLQLVFVEEPLLTERFGSSYQEYLARGPRRMLRLSQGEKP